MVKVIGKKKGDVFKRIILLLVISLFVNLVFVSALDISNVKVEEIRPTSAKVLWETDEPSNSFVKYGHDKNDLKMVGSSMVTTNHEVLLSGLDSEKEVFYSVKSGNLEDNNGGLFYSFTTLPPDDVPPPLNVEIPPFVMGNKLSLEGTSEGGSIITVKVNEILLGTVVADEEGDFSFTDIQLQQNEENKIVVGSKDEAGNEVFIDGKTFSDVSKPQLTLEDIPDLVDKNSFILKGNISEKVNLEIFVNNKSFLKKDNVDKIQENINLDEGENKIKLFLKDPAGWETEEERTIGSDTLPPTVTVNVEKGLSYYEGRAKSNIHGKTEPGAKSYLYIYKPLGYEFKPDFNKARAVVVADENGEFTFTDVNFQLTFLESFSKSGPKLVPSGLENLKISSIEQISQQERSTYYVYVIVEDKSGKTGYQQLNIQVNSCYSGDLDFSVNSMPQFQAPLILNPQLLDSGREEIQAVFDLEYTGAGIAKMSGEKIIDSPYKVNDIDIEKACTPGMDKDETFNIGCKILPRSYRKFISPDGTKLHVVWKLGSSEKFTERDKNFWEDFKKRQVLFPLKIKINYQERLEENKFGTTKTQTSCIDLGYFVDMPSNVDEFLPDWLINDGADFLNETITNINDVRGYLETAYFYAGVTSMASFGLRMGARLMRMFNSKFEFYTSIVKAKMSSEDAKTKGCPLNQNGLYLKSTVENWLKLEGTANIPKNFRGITSVEDPGISHLLMENRCPDTTGWWKVEATLEQAYKWSWDRSFCRSVPAGWTETKSVDKIQETLLKEQQCAVSGKGIPLVKKENCNKLIEASKQRWIKDDHLKGHTGTCWKTKDGTLYVNDPRKNDAEKNAYGVYHLTAVGHVLPDLQPKNYDLVVYKPQNVDEYIVGLNKNCKGKNSICNIQRPGKKYEGKCVPQTVKDGVTNLKIDGPNEYSAGYTPDCAPFNGKGLVEQCVCEGKKQEIKKYHSQDGSLRTAVEKKGSQSEEWFYRQERVFKESGKTKGTYYPRERYYADRDRSGAFGADYLLDYVIPGDPKTTKVNPHSGLIESVQSLCLSGIWAHLGVLQSVLEGARNCLLEAKKTGFHDAGMCKTFLTQNVCGLLYKGIAALTSGCSPSGFDDEKKASKLGDISAIWEAGKSGMASSLKTSIDDVKEDYGNAALNKYFEGGAQGFAQSLCLAAFGFEFPLFSEEFFMEALHSFPMKTGAVITPAVKTLSTYNPEKQSVVYNYEIGGMITPGCKMKNWKVSLKCLGPEDVGKPGIDTTCGGKGCDCLNVENPGPANVRTRQLKSGYNLPSGRMFDIPLESPLQVTSQYRYDHVILELMLDPSEKGNEDICFDENYHQGNKATYYFPIKDISPSGTFTCSASLISGKYMCPELFKMFGLGGAYFEQPFITCKNPGQDSGWVDCQTPNLFAKGDEVVIRPHLITDGSGQCLKRTVTPSISGVPKELPARLIPEGEVGPLFFEETLIKEIGEQHFSGGSDSPKLHRLDPPASDSGCGINLRNTPVKVTNSGQLYTFNYFPKGGDKIEVSLKGPTPRTVGYNTNQQGVLTKGGITVFERSELNKVDFNVGDFIINDVFKNVNLAQNGQCVYRTAAGSQISSSIDQRSLTVEYQLLERDEQGGCTYAKHQVKSAKPIAKTTVRLQKNRFVSKALNQIHQSFTNGNYQQVHTLSLPILNELKNDLTNALSIYYSVLSFIMQGKESGDIQTYATNIKTMLDYFYTGKWGSQTRSPYGPKVTNSGEFKKISKYLCEIDKKFGNRYQGHNYCMFAKPIVPPAPPKVYLCGKPNTKSGFQQPAGWDQYSCKSQSQAGGSWGSCLSRSDYSNTGGTGCPGTEKCCPVCNFDKKINIDMTDAGLKNILELLNQEFKWKISYEESEVKDQKVTLKLEGATLEGILNELKSKVGGLSWVNEGQCKIKVSFKSCKNVNDCTGGQVCVGNYYESKSWDGSQWVGKNLQDGICMDKRKKGESCGGNDECDGDLVCVDSGYDMINDDLELTTYTKGTCHEKLGEGKNCYSNLHCNSGFCIGIHWENYFRQYGLCKNENLIDGEMCFHFMGDCKSNLCSRKFKDGYSIPGICYVEDNCDGKDDGYRFFGKDGEVICYNEGENVCIKDAENLLHNFEEEHLGFICEELEWSKLQCSGFGEDECNNKEYCCEITGPSSPVAGSGSFESCSRCDEMPQ